MKSSTFCTRAPQGAPFLTTVPGLVIQQFPNPPPLPLGTFMNARQRFGQQRRSKSTSTVWRSASVPPPYPLHNGH